MWKLAVSIGLALLAQPASPDAASPLAFRIDEGHEINFLLRQGEIAAHLVLRSGTEPRILVAFPAGDSGTALWFANTQPPATWSLMGSPHAVLSSDSKGRPLRGIEAEMTSDAPSLRTRQALLSSVRVLRDYEAQRGVPASVLVSPLIRANELIWARDRLDGAPGYRLEVEVLDGGSVRSEGSGQWRLASGLHHPRQLHLIVRAFSGEHPLTPLGGELLAQTAAPDGRERDVLEFLSYRDKFLAGSWRFDTYFGRDTLISLDLLAPVLKSQAMESGIRSVLERLAPNGEIAHEEDIGEFAILENLASGRGAISTPAYDYKMVDESFLLAPVAARWLLDDPSGRARGEGFLARHNGNATAVGDLLVRNLLWVVARAARFADRPEFANLIGIKAGQSVGDWRDSANGLGGGRYPFDVNAVFVPVALGATARLVESGLLGPYLTSAQRATLTRAAAEQGVWTRHAPSFFVVSRSADQARAEIMRYARSMRIDPSAALASLGHDAVAFDALALDDRGRPIPVMHSDVGFALLFERPAPRDLERMLNSVTRAFPAGLLTPAGLLVANPAFAPPAVQALFTQHAYHGTVVWSWQQAVLAAGLERQLRRADLGAGLRAQLAAARKRLWAVIEHARALQASELWTWQFANGRYRVVPFEPQTGAVTGSDAAQLWSTTFLAVTRAQW